MNIHKGCLLQRVPLAASDFRGSIEPSGGFDRTFLGRSPISGYRFKIPSRRAGTQNPDTPQRQHFCFSNRPSRLLRGRRLSGSWGVSVLSRFSVGFWSVLVIFDRKWQKIAQELTQSRPLTITKCSIGVCCLWGMTGCGWNKSVDASVFSTSTPTHKRFPHSAVNTNV